MNKHPVRTVTIHIGSAILSSEDIAMNKHWTSITTYDPCQLKIMENKAIFTYQRKPGTY